MTPAEVAAVQADSLRRWRETTARRDKARLRLATAIRHLSTYGEEPLDLTSATVQLSAAESDLAEWESPAPRSLDIRCAGKCGYLIRIPIYADDPPAAEWLPSVLFCLRCQWHSGHDYEDYQ